MFVVRPAGPTDVDEIAALLASYMREHLDHPCRVTPADLLRDAFGDVPLVFLVVAQVGAALIGFAAWHPAYDLHHPVRGGTVIDLYVQPDRRGRGVAPAILTQVARDIARAGGVYMRGQAAGPDHPSGRLYGRLCVLFEGADANVGGRAFRELAALAGCSAREIARRLPSKSANYEP